MSGNPFAMLLWLLSLLLPALVAAHPQVTSTRTLPTESITPPIGTATLIIPTTSITWGEPEEPTRPPKLPPIVDCDSFVHPCYIYHEEEPCSAEWWRLLKKCEKDRCIIWKRHPGWVCLNKDVKPE
ncbi:hypothetical protein BJ508DRAFT_410010 [Ascobolus immersus RN42]|uniref:ShKT domain-containing protein n=1 Tax=Ascobolus immersus RN42 TaxID=1160509 RepID=A0A3N4IPL2_ASCIM|nr:hypothetical protein BJ508DRAFT_410010 [Ascobolus immersus RN42]